MNDDVWQREIARQRKYMWLSGFFAGIVIGICIFAMLYLSRIDLETVMVLINNSAVI
ncbi:MAG: hypothetical protein IMZ43_01590 [Thermoplasmata archaeon]|nr:hypothetical protein [Thermoplasmata archaeon]